MEFVDARGRHETARLESELSWRSISFSNRSRAGSEQTYPNVSCTLAASSSPVMYVLGGVGRRLLRRGVGPVEQ
jgi:hypothetical protein